MCECVRESESGCVLCKYVCVCVRVLCVYMYVVCMYPIQLIIYPTNTNKLIISTYVYTPHNIYKSKFMIIHIQ